MLVVGTGRLGHNFADRVERRAGLGVVVIGQLAVPEKRCHPCTPDPREHRGDRASLSRADRGRGGGVPGANPPALPRPRHSNCRGRGQSRSAYRLTPIGLPLPNAREEEFEGFVVRSLVFGQEHELGLAVKRAVDIAGSALALIVLSPLLLATALAVRLRATVRPSSSTRRAWASAVGRSPSASSGRWSRTPRSGTPRSPPSQTRKAPRSRCSKIRGSHPPARCCGGPASTNCPSSGTS